MYTITYQPKSFHNATQMMTSIAERRVAQPIECEDPETEPLQYRIERPLGHKKDRNMTPTTVIDRA